MNFHCYFSMFSGFPCVAEQFWCNGAIRILRPPPPSYYLRIRRVRDVVIAQTLCGGLPSNVLEYSQPITRVEFVAIIFYFRWFQRSIRYCDSKTKRVCAEELRESDVIVRDQVFVVLFPFKLTLPLPLWSFRYVKLADRPMHLCSSIRVLDTYLFWYDVISFCFRFALPPNQYCILFVIGRQAGYVTLRCICY